MLTFPSLFLYHILLHSFIKAIKYNKTLRQEIQQFRHSWYHKNVYKLFLYVEN
jgi:hypothetical protein